MGVLGKESKEMSGIDGLGPSTSIFNTCVGLKQLTNLSKERPRLFPHQEVLGPDSAGHAGARRLWGKRSDSWACRVAMPTW